MKFIQILKIMSLVFLFCYGIISCIKSTSPIDEEATIGNPSLQMLVPNGGEIFESTSWVYIEWTGKDVKTVKIEYSLDNGSSWHLIINYLPFFESPFLWQIPGANSDKVKIRISDVSHSHVSDECDSVFTISVPKWILESAEYYPLAVGNKWIYQTDIYLLSTHLDTFVTVREVTKDSVFANNKTYYKIETQFINRSVQIFSYGEEYPPVEWERTDRFTGKVFRLLPTFESGVEEYLIDDLLLDIGSSTKSIRMRRRAWEYYLETVVTNIQPINQFGIQTSEKQYKEKYTFMSIDYELVMGFGLISRKQNAEFQINDHLKGCIINGNVFGDISPVVIK